MYTVYACAYMYMYSIAGNFRGVQLLNIRFFVVNSAVMKISTHEN